MHHMDIQKGIRSETNVGISEIFALNYLTRTSSILRFERFHTGVFTHLIIVTFNNAQSQVNAFVLSACFQIKFVLRGWILATYANRIWTVGATIGTIHIAWAI